MKKNLKTLYKKWREISQEMLDDKFRGSLECGESNIREDFSGFEHFSKVITFERMIELERAYEANI